MMKVCSRGTRGSWPQVGGVVRPYPSADTARQAPRPCIMGCSDWTRSWPAGAWRTVPRMYRLP